MGLKTRSSLESIQFYLICFFTPWAPSTASVCMCNHMSHLWTILLFVWERPRLLYVAVYIWVIYWHCAILTACLVKMISFIYNPVLTLMLLVADWAITKWCIQTKKWLKPWHMGTHLRVLSENYSMNTNMTRFRWFSKMFMFASLCFGRK